MKPRIVRRISQGFFLFLLVWFCFVTVVGERWWEWRGWPVNWLLEMDPLAALGTLLATGTLYAGMAWAVVTIVVTLLFGRVFCGWICPFGTLHQFIGWLGAKHKTFAQRVRANQYHPAQTIKYYLLVFLLVAGGISTLVPPLRAVIGNALLTGLLDPIPMVTRSISLGFFPLGDGRLYHGAWVIGLIFVAFLLLNLWIPRFYCRFVCPLGALLGVIARPALWRIGKVEGECAGCEMCENNCEGACDPFGKIRTSECLVCLNCLEACRQAKMSCRLEPSAAGEIPSPEISRRGFVAAVAAGVAVPAFTRAAGMKGPFWNPAVLRPPGSLAERQFLDRCIKCGQCMRVCPTNIIQPALLQAGLSAVWTPVLNYHSGSSGCDPECIACGHVCPTAAIRPLERDEKRGRGAFADQGPTRIGTAFVDHGRCLPWAMDTPCIVCQENCPVSPKAIFIRDEYRVIRGGLATIASADGLTLTLEQSKGLQPDRLATGEYFVETPAARHRITANTASTITVEPGPEPLPPPGSRVSLTIHLQKPVVDPALCIGCGICEHECPVSGLRAIRVTAENESRDPRHSLLAG